MSLPQDQLMDDCSRGPGAEACEKGNGEGELSSEAKECNEIERDAGQDAPNGAFREGSHGVAVAFVVYVDPHQDEGAGQGHDGDQACCGREPFGDGRCGENNEKAKRRFDKDLHFVCFFRESSRLLPPAMRGSCLRLRDRRSAFPAVPNHARQWRTAFFVEGVMSRSRKRQNSPSRLEMLRKRFFDFIHTESGSSENGVARHASSRYPLACAAFPFFE